MSFLKSLAVGVAGVSKGILEGVGTLIEENQKLKEVELNRKLVETKKQFDKVMTDNIKNQEVFHEGTNIIVFYAANPEYRIVETIEKMETFIKKHTEANIQEQQVEQATA